MLRIRILPQASASLGEIAEWSSARFGSRQTEIYGSAFRDKFRLIARGHAASTHLEGVTGLERHRGVRITRTGSHYVLFKIVGEVLFIVDVIHTKRNLMSVELAMPGSDEADT